MSPGDKNSGLDPGCFKQFKTSGVEPGMTRKTPDEPRNTRMSHGIAADNLRNVPESPGSPLRGVPGPDPGKWDWGLKIGSQAPPPPAVYPDPCIIV